MNRETKLALIIGFAFILVVGVLVSDYFSTAQRAELADLSEGDRIAIAPPTIAPPGYARRPADPVTDPGSADPRRGEPSPSRGHLASPELPWDEPSRATPNAELFRPLVAESRDAGGITPIPPERIAAPIQINQSPAVPAEPEPREVVRHTVTEDDSLWDLAEQYYGKGSLWPRIAEANRPQGKRSDPTIRTGEVLIIPPMEGPVRRAGATPASTTPADTPRTNPPAAGKRTYTIKKGDALSIIAQKQLGTSKRMDEIIKLNRDKIADPDDIREGMVLVLPDR